MSSSLTKVDLEPIEHPDFIPENPAVVAGDGLGVITAPDGTSVVFNSPLRRQRRQPQVVPPASTGPLKWFAVSKAGEGLIKVKTGKIVSCEFTGLSGADPKPSKVTKMLTAALATPTAAVSADSVVYLKLTYTDLALSRETQLTGGSTVSITGGLGGKGGDGGYGGDGGRGGGGGSGGGGGGGGGGTSPGNPGGAGVAGVSGAITGIGGDPGGSAGTGGTGSSGGSAYGGGAGGVGGVGGSGASGGPGQPGGPGNNPPAAGATGGPTTAVVTVYTTVTLRTRIRYCTQAAIEVHPSTTPPTDTEFVGYIPVATVDVDGTLIKIEQHWDGTYTAPPFIHSYAYDPLAP